MGLRPNSTALSQMGSHLRWKSFISSARTFQSQLACTFGLFVAYIMSMKVCTGSHYLDPFLLNIYLHLFRLNCSFAWAGHSPLPGEDCSAMNKQNRNDV